jgi:uncharacterized protein YidB (DUF937 family)
MAAGDGPLKERLMGLLDSVIGALGGPQSGAAQGDPLQAVIAMLAQGQQAGGPGGLGGLLQQFEQGGLGKLAASWVGTGENLPISADQLQSVLGSDMVAQFAQSLGLSQGDAANQLSSLLPQVVDRMTPNGELPGAVGLDDLGGLLERFSRPG